MALLKAFFAFCMGNTFESIEKPEWKGHSGHYN